MQKSNYNYNMSTPKHSINLLYRSIFLIIEYFHIYNTDLNSITYTYPSFNVLFLYKIFPILELLNINILLFNIPSGYPHAPY